MTYQNLVRSLDDEQAARALLSPVAPVDIVGGNQPQVRDGDLLLPLPEVWRGRSCRDVAVLDAPVSGGPKGARSGHLTIWVGGDASVYAHGQRRGTHPRRTHR